MNCLRRKELSLEEMMPLITERLSEGGTVRITPKGTSMLPMLRERCDSVILSPVPQALKKYDLPLYRRKNGKYILHRVIEVNEGYTCMGDNQFERECGIEHSQIIALVTAFYRGNKLYSTESISYRLYCRFWHLSRPVRHIIRRVINRLNRYIKRGD